MSAASCGDDLAVLFFDGEGLLILAGLHRLHDEVDLRRFAGPQRVDLRFQAAAGFVREACGDFAGQHQIAGRAGAAVGDRQPHGGDVAGVDLLAGRRGVIASFGCVTIDFEPALL